ncbi:PREDICTED: glycerate kinase-like [Amphimedon queenslandica]|uniref:Glycerate kinase n=1 Tax=Amphimedon queenslandica TaxID=400682 RepID=A0A1X7TIC8_AMPQE|nr:PREDICTED: glycerate kinase-like [Amphimedon queenslandica]|eukprot:XP_011407500.1 PREDICTED: glycerate kinase-like [Amphimedon queenslandica]
MAFSSSPLHILLSKIYTAGVEAVRPASLVRQAMKVDALSSTLHIDGKQYQLQQNVLVVGFGKAVLGMTVALDSLLKGHIKRGIVSVPLGTTLQYSTEALVDSNIKVIEGAAYNLPDPPAETAAREILQLVGEASDGDLVVALVSGGGSALLPVPGIGISLEDKRKTIESLSAAGAAINELNIIRQCLSQVKGGKLAAKACPAQMLGLILSDIVNDPLEYIASGPTIPQLPDNTLALKIIKKYDKMESLPKPVLNHLSQLHLNSAVSATPSSAHVHNVLIGNNSMATRAAEKEARSHGCDVVTWSHAVQGEARDIGYFYAEIACDIMNKKIKGIDITERIKTLTNSLSLSVPHEDIERLYNEVLSFQHESSNRLCIISGGEPTVTLHGNGKGGRNQELALSFAKHIHHLMQRELEITTKQQEKGKQEVKGGKSNVLFCSIGTDGQDGPTDAAGAIVNGESWSNALRQGLDPDRFLKENDSYSFFSTAQGASHVKLGLTGTNVMDIHILLIE